MSDAHLLGIVADIGGTHARFALAALSDAGELELRDCHVFATADFASLEEAFAAYRAKVKAPGRAAFAIAGPLSADEVKLTNCPWAFRQSQLKGSLKLERLSLVNDFAAIGHALAYCGPGDFQSLTASPFALPQNGAISIVGPGTGMGVGLLLRRPGEDIVVATEGGHIGFAPPDAPAFQMLEGLWQKHGRVSAERILCGDGLAHIYEALGGDSGKAPVTLWQGAIAGDDPLATAAMERWLYLLGMYAGDIALAHGAVGVVMAGGILPRLGRRLRADIFLGGFCDKGRFSARMAQLPVAMLVNPQPGLLGAAAVLKSLD